MLSFVGILIRNIFVVESVSAETNSCSGGEKYCKQCDFVNKVLLLLLLLLLLIPNSCQENLYVNHILRTTKSNYKVLTPENCVTKEMSQLVFFCDIPQTEI